ncbi:uncharacterized protein L199_000772 [Kwoniella botswanensis]|uniref:uncharacterized protein n=1 Tax=Kwoniella botswanensis TaxID=1268659 RepID=UPI00315C70FE
MAKRRATYLPSPAPASSQITNIPLPHATTPLSQSRFKRPKLTHTSHTDVVLEPFSYPESEDDQRIENDDDDDDDDEPDDILLTPREGIIPTVTSTTSRIISSKSTFISPSPSKKTFRLNPKTIIHPDEIDVFIPLNHPTSTSTDAIDLPLPPRIEIPYKSPTKVIPKKMMKNGRRVLNKEMTVDVLEEAMDFLYENFTSDRLSKKYKMSKSELRDQFNSYSSRPDGLIQMNIRKKVMDMFGMYLTFLLPSLNHLDGVGLDRSTQKERTGSDEGWEEMGRDDSLEDGRSLETRGVRDECDEQGREDTKEEAEYGNESGSEDQDEDVDEDVSMGDD